MTRRHHVFLALFAIAYATPALAEVSDKIPSVASLWGWAIVCPVFALLLGWKRPVLGLLVMPFAVLRAWGGYDMVTSDIAPAILNEQGQGYVDTVYASSAVAVIGPVLVVLALVFWRRPKAG